MPNITMKEIRILISGCGIAGPCLAWWLQKAQLSVHITVVERAPSPRTSGQAVDIRDAAVDIIKAMNLEELIKSKTTTEEGVDFVYGDGVTKARFPSSRDSSNQSFTSEYEILRGDLAEILIGSTRGIETVTYVFDEYIAAIEQQDDSNGKVTVKFANHLPNTEYDLVVGADGIMSRTRRLVFGRGLDGGDYLKRLGQYYSFFTIPRNDSDTTFSQWYFGTKGRAAITRPSPYNDTRAYLVVTDSNLSRFEGLRKAKNDGPEMQKKWLVEQFEGAGWQTARIVDGMKAAEDFYIQEIAQVKMEKFVKGRVALLGDAGFCPSPFSGVVSYG